MLPFNKVLFTIFIIHLCFFQPGPANSRYLDDESLLNIVFFCIEELPNKYECDRNQEQGAIFKLTLPKLKPVITADGIPAFRIMPALTNYSKKKLANAKLRVQIGEEQGPTIDFGIFTTTRYKMTSSTEFSYLIRSDVPKMQDFYLGLEKAYKANDWSVFYLDLIELNYLDR